MRPSVRTARPVQDEIVPVRGASLAMDFLVQDWKIITQGLPIDWLRLRWRTRSLAELNFRLFGYGTTISFKDLNGSFSDHNDSSN
jgi:hypothetical protein